MQVRTNPAAISQNGFNGLDGRHVRQPVSAWAELYGRHGAGNGHIGLSRAGLRVLAGRQRRPRHGDRHRSGLLCSVYAGAIRSAGARLSDERVAADYFEDSAERAHIRAESRADRSAEPVQCRTRCDCRQYRNADRSSDKGAGQCQLRSVAGFAVFALRSDGGVAGNCLEWRQCGTCGMGRSRRGRD